MDKQTLIRYLEDVVELEKQVFLQQQTLDALDSKIRSLGIKNDFYEPTYNKPKKLLEGEGGGIGCISGLVAVGVFLAGCFLMSATDCGDFGALWITVFLAAIITSIAAAIIISNNKKKQAQDDHNSRLTEYRRTVSADARRVNRELAEKRILEQERSALYQKHLQTKQVLQRYYDLNIIYGKYRNFVAVSSFVDYFKSGRCSTLGENTGGDGAYNTFETEVRLDRIVDRLDVLISMLSEIKSNQWSIYNAIQEGNSISSRLVESTNRLAESSAQTAHYAGITAANSAIAAYNSQQAANEAEHLRKLKQYELGIRSRRY